MRSLILWQRKVGMQVVWQGVGVPLIMADCRGTCTRSYRRQVKPLDKLWRCFVCDGRSLRQFSGFFVAEGVTDESIHHIHNLNQSILPVLLGDLSDFLD